MFEQAICRYSIFVISAAICLFGVALDARATCGVCQCDGANGTVLTVGSYAKESACLAECPTHPSFGNKCLGLAGGRCIWAYYPGEVPTAEERQHQAERFENLPRYADGDSGDGCYAKTGDATKKFLPDNVIEMTPLDYNCLANALGLDSIEDFVDARISYKSYREKGAFVWPDRNQDARLTFKELDEWLGNNRSGIGDWYPADLGSGECDGRFHDNIGQVMMVYGKSGDEILHFARLIKSDNAGGLWESKEGQAKRSVHRRDEIAGTLYGQALFCMYTLK